jgi:hypothetical protein
MLAWVKVLGWPNTPVWASAWAGLDVAGELEHPEFGAAPHHLSYPHVLGQHLKWLLWRPKYDARRREGGRTVHVRSFYVIMTSCVHCHIHVDKNQIL